MLMRTIRVTSPVAENNTHKEMEKNVVDLRKFLRERGVVCSDIKKAELVQLYEKAKELELHLDPDFVVDDWQQVVSEKLRDGDNILPDPSGIIGGPDLSILPIFSYFDIFTYQLGKNVPVTCVRDYRRSEAYTMMEDGYVINLAAAKVPCPDHHHGYFVLKARVKPRTRDKDPVSGAPYYHVWVILTSVAIDKRSCILSALCTCKGGMDGCCRHILATLYEVIDFVEESKVSVTSGPCLWIRRANASSKAVLITDLQIDSNQKTPEQNQQQLKRPVEELYHPLHDSLPSHQEFLDGVAIHLPESCFLTAWRPIAKNSQPPPPPLRVETPAIRFKRFRNTHICSKGKCDCAYAFFDILLYSHEERNFIDKDTEGQYKNENWFRMRDGLITASVVKKIISSQNLINTANNLLAPNLVDEKHLPPAIAFGRKYESKALKLFLKLHRYRHRKCTFRVPGLIVSQSDAFIAASPDGIVKCSHCGDFIVEIKCLFSKQNFHPRAAVVSSGICMAANDGTLSLKISHSYFAQIQCQMAVTGLQSAYLVIYTKKGIEPVLVSFDPEWWASAVVQLRTFYLHFFFPIWSSKLTTDGPFTLCDADQDKRHFSSEDANDQQPVCSSVDFLVAGIGTDSVTENRESSFRSLLASKHFALHGFTPGDGNCFFHAISLQLERTGSGSLHHAEIRRMTCQYLSNLSLDEKTELARFVAEKPLDDYIADMSKEGTYADHIMVEYTSRVLSKPITVVGTADVLIGTTHFSGEMLYVGYIQSLQHYVSIEPDHPAQVFEDD